MKPTENFPKRPNDVSPLLVGEAIPVVLIPDANGQPFHLNLQVAEQPTILIFYRGGWCPYCNLALAGIQCIESELTTMGYQLIAISTDSPENLSASANEHQLGYTLLSDADLNIAKQFGIAYTAPADYEEELLQGSDGKNTDKLIPVPSVFILDKRGVIEFEYITTDFTHRISPTLLKAAALALTANLN